MTNRVSFSSSVQVFSPDTLCGNAKANLSCGPESCTFSLVCIFAEVNEGGKKLFSKECSPKYGTAFRTLSDLQLQILDQQIPSLTF